tara:strand:+ start:374 stop:601 length:228 start_codon:yes stop_codon:yes gene_type:complete
MKFSPFNITAIGIATVTVIYSYGMLVTRVMANESKIKDLDMLRIDARLSVIEATVVQINKKIDDLVYIDVSDTEN